MRYFKYTDTDGRTKEDLAYVSSDFVYLSAPNSPVVTGPGGTLHPSVLPETLQAKAASLVVVRIAVGSIERGDVIRTAGDGKVTIADPSDTFVKANAFGVALQTVADGEEVEILLIGTITDPIFSAFTLDSVLFLDSNGGITDERPTSPKKFLVVVGRYLGANEVLVNISYPTKLGA